MPPPTRLVPRLVPRDEAVPNVAERIKNLQSQARSLARAHVGDLICIMNDLGEAADAIAQGGEAYPAGVRSEARCLSDQLDARGLTIAALMDRLS